jgi:ribonuclease HI
VRGILYLGSNHYILFKVGIGKETNNFYELTTLKLMLQLAQEYGVSQLQIYGNSLLVIQWLRKEATIINFTLQPLYDDTQIKLTTFSHISLYHIYRDKNKVTYVLL